MAKPPPRKPKKKVCVFCKEKISYVDYKDTNLLRKFISDRGKIRARRVSGNCTQHQRDVATAVKNSREMALLPYTSTARERGRETMKLILTQEVTGLGAPGDVVEVKDGYGRNFLVPRGVAIRWTRGGEKQIDSIRRGREVREIQDLGDAKDVKGRLENLSVKLPVRAGETGRLFGAVTVADIVAAVSKAGGPQVDKRRVEVSSPIKTVGAHQVSVRLHPEITATVNVEVVAES
jgi:large subunit ribosomal protein L9